MVRKSKVNSNFTFSNLGIRNGYNILFKNVNSESNNSTNFKDTPNQELFSMDELVQAFDLERVSKSGAKFDLDKAKWFNQHYLKNTLLM